MDVERDEVIKKPK